MSDSRIDGAGGSSRTRTALRATAARIADHGVRHHETVLSRPIADYFSGWPALAIATCAEARDLLRHLQAVAPESPPTQQVQRLVEARFGIAP